MAQWKKQAKRRYSAEYLKFEKDKAKKLTISDWDFERGSSGYLFKCYVIKEDGKEADKIWTVWDYESARALKKKLGTRNVSVPRELKVVMHKNDEDESYFELL
jgi:hypothetical protein